MIFDTLETERLIIREFSKEDFTLIHGYASKPEVTMYLPFGPNDEDDSRHFVKKIINYQMQNPRYDYEFAVVLKQSNKLIGGCGIHITSINDKEGSIVYCYDNQYWGKGYATEAAKVILRFGFNKLGLHRIFATCHPDNIASAKVMGKIGMQNEGRLREHKFIKGNWRDSLIYSILDYEHNSNS